MYKDQIILTLARCFSRLRCYGFAWRLLTSLKAQGRQLQGVDCLRGKLRLMHGYKDEARELLKEELRLFPQNTEAQMLLNTVSCQDPRLVGLDSRQNAEAQLFRKLLPYTMLSIERLDALLRGAKLVCETGLHGNFVECGVSAGGSSALLAWAIKNYSKEPRFIYCFDTFEGMPAPGVNDTHSGTPAQETIWGQGTCAAPLESLLTLAHELDVADVIRPAKGMFQEMLPVMKSEIGSIALLHLDGDWYDSTRAILENLYQQASQGAYMQVDDYGHWDGCRKAINDFQKQIGVDFQMHAIDGTGVSFIKPAT